MQLYLIRHGESHVNRDGWETLPSMDAGLTEKGQQQAAALRDWLRDHAVQADMLYSSTMRRTRETAAYIRDALGLDIVYDDRIREIGNNHTAGLPVEESRLPRTFNPQWADVAPFAPRTAEFDDAESWVHLRVRVAQFVDYLAQQHPQQVVYAVTHGGVIAAMFDNVFNVGPYRRCDVHNVNSSWSLFEYRTDHGREPWLLRHHNRIDHLMGTALL